MVPPGGSKGFLLCSGYQDIYTVNLDVSMLEEELKKFNLTEDQIQQTLTMFGNETVERALKATVFPSKALLRMNLLLFKKHPL